MPAFLSLTEMPPVLSAVKGRMVDGIATIVNKQQTWQMPLDRVAYWISQQVDGPNYFGKAASAPWHLKATEVNGALQSIQQLRRCVDEMKGHPLLCCLKPPPVPLWQTDKLDQLEERLRTVERVYNYIFHSVIVDAYYRPAVSGLVRAISVHGSRCFVHFNKKKQGDRLFGRGSGKKVKACAELGTPNIFATAGYVDKIEDLRYIRDNLVQAELDHLYVFQEIPGFVHIICHIQYGRGKAIKYRAVFEYCNGGTLHKAVDRLSKDEKKSIFIELIQNLSVMHRMGYLHRDVKLDNIMLHREHEEGRLESRIGDFGGVCKQEDEAARKNQLTTWEYCAPEYAAACLLEDADLLMQATTMASDSWSLGISLFRLFNMGMYYQHVARAKSERQMIECLAKLPANWLSEPRNPQSPQHLVWELLQVDIAKRLLVTEAEERLEALDWSGWNRA